MIRDVNLAQLLNTLSPIEVTELGIVKEVKLWQLMKANEPIEVTESGIEIDLIFVHPEKA